MPRCTEVGLGSGHIVLDGDPATPTERGTTPPTFRSVSVVAKRWPISAIAELLLDLSTNNKAVIQHVKLSYKRSYAYYNTVLQA